MTLEVQVADCSAKALVDPKTLDAGGGPLQPQRTWPLLPVNPSAKG